LNTRYNALIFRTTGGRAGQLDAAKHENKKLSEAKRGLKAALKAKHAEMTRLHDSYESALEEKLVGIQAYVQQLEDCVRCHALSNPPPSLHGNSPSVVSCLPPTSGTATAVSPQGTYRLKSSLTYDIQEDMLSEDLLAEISNSVDKLADSIRGTCSKLMALGLPSATQNGAGNDGLPNGKSCGGVDGDIAEMQLSAIQNVSAATLVLSSPHIDRFESLRLSPHLSKSGLLFLTRFSGRWDDVESSRRNEAERDEIAFSIIRKHDQGQGARKPAQSGREFSNLSVAFDTCNAVASEAPFTQHADGSRNAFTPRRGPKDDSPKMYSDASAHARILSPRNASNAYVVGDERAWHIKQPQKSTGHWINGRLSSDLETQKDEGDLFSAQQKQARIERHLEREALLQSLDM
jgi:hypothetical protein